MGKNFVVGAQYRMKEDYYNYVKAGDIVTFLRRDPTTVGCGMFSSERGSTFIMFYHRCEPLKEQPYAEEIAKLEAALADLKAKVVGAEKEVKLGEVVLIKGDPYIVCNPNSNNIKLLSLSNGLRWNDGKTLEGTFLTREFVTSICTMQTAPVFTGKTVAEYYKETQCL